MICRKIVFKPYERARVVGHENRSLIFCNLRILYQKSFLSKDFFRFKKRGLTQTHCEISLIVLYTILLIGTL